MRKAVFSILLLACPLLRADDKSTDGEALTLEKRDRALKFIKSDDPRLRKGAYEAFRALEPPQREAYAEVLERARDHHEERLAAVAFDLSYESPTFTDFESKFDDWQRERTAAYGIVRVHWKAKDPTRAKQMYEEMDRRMVEAERAWAEVVNAATKTGKPELKHFDKIVAALNEIDYELAWAERAKQYPAPSTALKLLHEGSGNSDFLATYDEALRVQRIAASAELIDKRNAECSWAAGQALQFARLLNPRRVALGLAPLRLDEKLSKACRLHSEEMVALGYFSHTSPTKKNRTPGMRAKNAGYAGGWSGECIFKGSVDPAGAHRAWWYSDGHRTIMYAKGPNTLGIGTGGGSTWTLNTGKRKWGP